MKVSTTISKKIIIISLWLIIWQIGSELIGSPILFASPFQVGASLVGMVKTVPFWFTILNSFFKILLGFIIGLIFGACLAIISYRLSFVYEFLSPIFSLIKSIPVASFIVLLLVWVNTKLLSTVVGFLIVIPIVYENIYNGLQKVDKELIEMSRVFNVPMKKQVRYLYFSNLVPYIMTAVSVGIGFCFKSGIAAEVIGICRHTIGEAIYMSKINLETANVMAWTIVIVAMSAMSEYVAKLIIKSVQKEKANND